MSLLLLTSLLLMSHDTVIPLPLLLLLSTDSVVADVIAVVGFLGSQLIYKGLLLLAPCCCWFSYVPSVPAVDKVSAVAAVPTAVDVLSDIGVSYVPGVLSVVGVPAFAVVPILLASPDVLIVYCTAVCCQPFCLCTDISFCFLYFPGVPAVASILLTSMLLLRCIGPRLSNH